MTDLTTLPHAAATYLRKHGWVQGKEVAPNGKACLTGALKMCSPQPGDWLIAREVFRRRDRAENWNDAKGRTLDEVLDALNCEITDADLQATFGPQWEPIIALVRRTAVLTDDEASRLAAARDAARAATWDARDATWDATWAAARGAAWDAARAATWDAAWDATWDAAWDATRGAAWDAARALVVRDLIGQHGLTQEHYDTLTAPWAQVIGKVHPDDPEVQPLIQQKDVTP